MPPLLEVLGTSEWLSNPSKLARKGKADEDVGWGCWGTEENLLNIYLISWIFYSLIFAYLCINKAENYGKTQGCEKYSDWVY